MEWRDGKTERTINLASFPGHIARNEGGAWDRESHRPNTHLLFKLQSPVRVGAVEAEASLQ